MEILLNNVGPFSFLSKIFESQLNICAFSGTLFALSSAVVQIMHFFGTFWDKFALNLVLIYNQNLKNNQAETAPSNINSAIWDEFSDYSLVGMVLIRTLSVKVQECI